MKGAPSVKHLIEVADFLQKDQVTWTSKDNYLSHSLYLCPSVLLPPPPFSFSYALTLFSLFPPYLLLYLLPSKLYILILEFLSYFIAHVHQPLTFAHTHGVHVPYLEHRADSCSSHQ